MAGIFRAYFYDACNPATLSSTSIEPDMMISDPVSSTREKSSLRMSRASSSLWTGFTRKQLFARAHSQAEVIMGLIQRRLSHAQSDSTLYITHYVRFSGLVQ